MNENLNNQPNNTTTQTPKGVEFSALLQEVLMIVSLPEDLIRCVFAVALSTKLNLYPPLWLLLVGVPSSAKTDIVSLLRKTDFVYFIDSFTMNPFASGYKPNKGEKAYDLLPELNGKCFVCKDYTTIFSMNEETTKKLLGELVSIYDGEFAKFSPTRGYQSYKSSFSHIGCITPAALNAHHRYLNIVGPRFMCYRIPNLDETQRKKGFEIAWKSQDRRSMLFTLGEKTKRFFDELVGTSPTFFEIIDPKTRDILEKLAALMAQSRGSVITQSGSFKNDKGEEIHYYDITDTQVEEPWRAFLQLRGLAVCLALLDGRNYLSEDDIRILKHVVISSMPAERAEVLGHFLNNDTLTTKQLSEVIGKSIRTCQRLLKELEGLGIVKSDITEQVGKFYTMEENFKILGTAKKQAPSEYLSSVLPDKPVSEYSDDELEGIPSLVRDYLEDNLAISKEIREKYLALGEEIRLEKEKRCRGSGGLPIADQLLINSSLEGRVYGN